MPSEFWAAILGALVGALAGGGITAVIQHCENRRVKRESSQASAKSLLFKLMKVYSDLHGYRLHVQECEARADQMEIPHDSWQSFRAIGNGPSKVEFTADEKSFLLSLDSENLFNLAISLDAVHSSMIDIFNLYAARRLALTSQLPADMNGLIGTVELNQEEYRRFAPLAAELNDLVASIRQRAARDEREAHQVLEQYNDQIAHTLGKKLSLELQDAPIN